MAAVSKKGEVAAELRKKMEMGLIPDEEIRRTIRVELAKRLQWGYKPTYEEQTAQLVNFAHSLRKMNMAMEIDVLESKMYDLPFSFYKLMRGNTMKLSCCYFENEYTTLEEAAMTMLNLYCERAQIQDGQKVLDVGCGYGGFLFYVARKYSNCQVTGVTNSISQKDYIEDQIRNNNIPNVKVILADITMYEMDERFDRVMVIGVIEHMKNFELFLRKISQWMAPDGRLFIEHLCHKTIPYHYEPLDEDDWLIEYLFNAGTYIMASANLLLYFQDDVSVVSHWIVNGKHYARTSEEALKKTDVNAETMREIIKSSTGSEEAAVKQVNYWRAFFLYRIEFFKYNDGEEWMISHLLFKKK